MAALQQVEKPMSKELNIIVGWLVVRVNVLSAGSGVDTAHQSAGSGVDTMGGGGLADSWLCRSAGLQHLHYCTLTRLQYVSFVKVKTCSDSTVRRPFETLHDTQNF